MGILSSRQASSPNADDVVPAHSYKYPPKSGQYFGTHFMMGGERFESTQPEAYLFGDNTDLNFLGPKPVAFSYSQPSSAEPTRTLQCLTAIRRDSLKFTRLSPDQKRLHSTKGGSESKLAISGGCGSKNGESFSATTALARPHSVQVDLTNFDETQYNIEFVFDSDAPCSITIYYFATEETGPDGLRYVSRRPELTSTTYQYEIGANQVFSHPEHVFDPCVYRADELLYNNESEIIPVVIHCVAESPDNGSGPQSHSTLAIVEKSAEGSGFILKPLKQKIYVDGVCYLLQEIYGIENKLANAHPATNNNGTPESSNPSGGVLENRLEQAFDASNEESGTECVVCMSELRDTLILPCRHLCLCSGCAETLRYKASCCPICRAPFRALLQVKTLRRIRAGVGPVVAVHSVDQAVTESNVSSTTASFLNRYETVPLIEALNGPIEAPTVMLPINPIPPVAQSASTASVGASGRGGNARRGLSNVGGTAASSGQRRAKGKKVRSPAVIQEVLTPQALVQATPVEEASEHEDKLSTCDTLQTEDEHSLALSKISPRSSAKNSVLEHPLSGQLLPGQADDDEDIANSDDEYVEAHSVACGEVVTKPELEGPTVSDDEPEVAFEGPGSSNRASTGRSTRKNKSQRKTELSEDAKISNMLDASTAAINIRAGSETPNSNNSVSSVASTHSSQPLLSAQSKMADTGSGQ